VADGVAHRLLEGQDEILDQGERNPVLVKVVADALTSAQQTGRVKGQVEEQPRKP
jgi:hypothetical protein